MEAPSLAQNPLLNHLLAELPSEAYQRLLPDLAGIPLPLGEEIYAAGETLKYVYFPTTAIVSLLYTTEDGRSAEIGVVGNDGILGIAFHGWRERAQSGRGSK